MHNFNGNYADVNAQYWLADVPNSCAYRYKVFYLGISQTMVLSTGINFISDVVGSKAKTGAFVFGVYSLFDKFGSGIIIFLIGNSTAYT